MSNSVFKKYSDDLSMVNNHLIKSKDDVGSMLFDAKISAASN